MSSCTLDMMLRAGTTSQYHSGILVNNAEFQSIHDFLRQTQNEGHSTKDRPIRSQRQRQTEELSQMEDN